MTSLILIPTAPERDNLEPKLRRAGLLGRDWQVAICGFGPIAAAARTMSLIHTIRPARIILVGIAGTYCETRLPVGSASTFHTVLCDGIGVGAGNEHQPAAALGWYQWPGIAGVSPNGADESPSGANVSIGDRLALIDASTIEIAGRKKSGSTSIDSTPTLLTVCAASANPAEADRRRQRFPHAWAEDMEGFGVALSCQLTGVPLQIVRGVSNRVGDRAAGNWQTEPALTAAAEQARQLATMPFESA